MADAKGCLAAYGSFILVAAILYFPVAALTGSVLIGIGACLLGSIGLRLLVEAVYAKLRRRR